MPLYKEIKRLDNWESAFQDATDTENACETETTNELAFSLLLEIFEFGRYNLYGAFNAEDTRRESEALVTLLKEHGIEISKTFDVSDW